MALNISAATYQPLKKKETFINIQYAFQLAEIHAIALLYTDSIYLLLSLINNTSKIYDLIQNTYSFYLKLFVVQKILRIPRICLQPYPKILEFFFSVHLLDFLVTSIRIILVYCKC